MQRWSGAVIIARDYCRKRKEGEKERERGTEKENMLDTAGCHLYGILSDKSHRLGPKYRTRHSLIQLGTAARDRIYSLRPELP